MLMPVAAEALAKANMKKGDIGFTVSGSSDYFAGTPFSFVMTLDGVGPWPPIQESHVEMDGAWALYEAWVKIQMGEVDSALIYSYSKASPGPLREVLTRQLDPYFLGPLWVDPVSLAALQAHALIDAGKASEKEMAEVAARSRKSALDNNPYAQLRWDKTADQVLAEPMFVSPFRRDDCPPITDGVAAVIIAADDVARSHCDRPAWIRGIDHRIESAALGERDLTDSASTRLAAEKAGATGSFDVAEIHAPFTSQELILREALGLGDDVDVNPSGGALAANPMMAAGLIRLGEAADRIIDGRAGRALAHATSGACLQQNLVCVLEGEK
jgi:acetyl-CoA acetyltransferase